MRKFETGKRYNDGVGVIEILKRTNKTVTFTMIQHAGRCNEKKGAAKTTKIHDWNNREVIYSNCYQFEA